MEELQKELQELEGQKEQAKALFMKLQGAIEYVQAKIEQKKVASEEKSVVKKKK
jgi:hypothetical protein